jgi:hypothetical protein
VSGFRNAHCLPPSESIVSQPIREARPAAQHPYKGLVGDCKALLEAHYRYLGVLLSLRVCLCEVYTLTIADLLVVYSYIAWPFSLFASNIFAHFNVGDSIWKNIAWGTLINAFYMVGLSSDVFCLSNRHLSPDA